MIPKNHTYRPLPDYLTIKESSIDGLGLHTVEAIESGHIVNHDCTHVVLSSGELKRTAIGSFINHSDTPNAMLIQRRNELDRYYLKITKDIPAGEEITVDYNDHMFCIDECNVS